MQGKHNREIRQGKRRRKKGKKREVTKGRKEARKEIKNGK